MEAASEYRSWDELIPEALGLIFSKVSLLERLAVISWVCKSWAKVVSEPHCWQEIDILQRYKRGKPDELGRIIEKLIARSSGSVRKLCFYDSVPESIFTFIAVNAGCLQTLRMPKCNVSDSIMEQIAGRISLISCLDVSYCWNLSARGLEGIGKNCKLLEMLGRNMDPWHTSNMRIQDDEGTAIASTMPNLKHLEMACHVITADGVSQIVCACPKLEFLDLSCCWDPGLGGWIRKQKFPKLKVLQPFFVGKEWFDLSQKRIF